MGYNKHKIGVDKSDHMLAYYTLQSDSVKSQKKDFFPCLQSVYGKCSHTVQ
jgi:hypothetical protein